jgi:hypothetical protein
MKLEAEGSGSSFAAGVSAGYWRKTVALAVQVHRPRAGFTLAGMLVSDAIVSFSGQVQSADSRVQGEGFPQVVHVPVETILDRLQYLMPAGVRGTSGFPEIVWIGLVLPAGIAAVKLLFGAGLGHPKGRRRHCDRRSPTTPDRSLHPTSSCIFDVVKRTVAIKSGHPSRSPSPAMDRADPWVHQ